MNEHYIDAAGEVTAESIAAGCGGTNGGIWMYPHLATFLEQLQQAMRDIRVVLNDPSKLPEPVLNMAGFYRSTDSEGSFLMHPNTNDIVVLNCINDRPFDYMDL